MKPHWITCAAIAAAPFATPKIPHNPDLLSQRTYATATGDVMVERKVRMKAEDGSDVVLDYVLRQVGDDEYEYIPQLQTSAMRAYDASMCGPGAMPPSAQGRYWWSGEVLYGVSCRYEGDLVMPAED